MNLTRQRVKYLLSDWLMVTIGWIVFYVYRYDVTGHMTFGSLEEFLSDGIVLCNIFISSFIWLGIFTFSGYYSRPYFKSHLEELQTTFFSVLVGSLCFFFSIVIDDVPFIDFIDDQLLGFDKVIHVSPRTYLQILLTMFCCVFVPVYISRYFITHFSGRKAQRGEIGWSTLLIGDGKAARALLKELDSARQNEYHIIGCIHPDGEKGTISENADRKKKMIGNIPVLGNMSQLASIMSSRQVDAFLLAPDLRTSKVIYRLVYELMPYDVPIRMRAADEEIEAGLIRTNSLTSIPMQEFGSAFLTPFQRNMKRLGDVTFALFALLLVSPLMLLMCILIPRTSPGPIFYSQERVGRIGKKFKVWKFRSMYVDAESDGPRLSSEGDPRITPLGQFIRKYRIDELPQFFNVLKGDMSIVGPRPEREYYIRQIIEVAPYYTKLFQVRPGITSWGQVKYGYAGNLFQMVERMRYDLMYIDNCSMLVDLKIICYTIRTVLTGKGI